MANTAFTTLLTALSAKIDLPGLQPDTEGTCLLRFDDSIEVEISVDEAEPAHLVLFTDIGLVSEGERAHLYPEFLEANVLCRDATIGVVGDAGLAVLSYREVIAGMTPERFEVILKNFVDQTEMWKKCLATEDTSSESDSIEAVPANVQQALDRSGN